MNTLYSVISNKFTLRPYQSECIKALNNHDVIINWWCRQSGKTEINIHLVHNAVAIDNTEVIIIVNNDRNGIYYKDAINKSFYPGSIEYAINDQIVFKNKSSIIFVRVNRAISPGYSLPKATALVIIDDFDWIDNEHFKRVCELCLKSKNKSLYENIIRWFHKKKTPSLKIVFSSSRNSNENYKFLIHHELNPVVSRINSDAINNNWSGQYK